MKFFQPHAEKIKSERREIDLLEDTSISFYESSFYKTCRRHAPSVTQKVLFLLPAAFFEGEGMELGSLHC